MQESIFKGFSLMLQIGRDDWNYIQKVKYSQGIQAPADPMTQIRVEITILIQRYFSHSNSR